MKRQKKHREKLWEEATGHCIYCGRPVSLEEMEVDHITPLCQGGENSYGNKVCSCPRCNAAKAGLSLEEFLSAHMGAKQRKRLSNRVNELAAQEKLAWQKADMLDPYTKQAFDGDWEDEEKEVDLPPLSVLHFSGELAIRFW